MFCSHRSPESRHGEALPRGLHARALRPNAGRRGPRTGSPRRRVAHVRVRGASTARKVKFCVILPSPLHCSLGVQYDQCVGNCACFRDQGQNQGPHDTLSCPSCPPYFSVRVRRRPDWPRHPAPRPLGTLLLSTGWQRVTCWGGGSLVRADARFCTPPAVHAQAGRLQERVRVPAQPLLQSVGLLEALCVGARAAVPCAVNAPLSRPHRRLPPVVPRLPTGWAAAARAVLGGPCRTRAQRDPRRLRVCLAGSERGPRRVWVVCTSTRCSSPRACGQSSV